MSAVVCQTPPSSSGSFVYIFEVEGLPRYVGKGRRRRPWDHITDAKAIIAGKGKQRRSLFACKLAGALRRGERIEIKIICDRLSNDEAVELEKQTIADIGLDKLWNIAPGGEGLSPETARVVNADPKKRAQAGSKIRSLWRDPKFREHVLKSRDKPLNPDIEEARRQKLKKSWTPERRAKQAENARARWAREGEREKQRAVMLSTMTPEVRERVTNMNRGRVKSEEELAKLSASLKAAYSDPTNGLRNKKPRRDLAEFSQKTASANRERWADPEKRAAISAKISETLKRRNAERKGK